MYCTSKFIKGIGSNFYKECAGKQKKDLNSLHITKIWHKECDGNQKNANVLFSETADLYGNERVFRQELLAPGQGIQLRNGIPL
jgi:hypothetical protein